MPYALPTANRFGNQPGGGQWSIGGQPAQPPAPQPGPSPWPQWQPPPIPQWQVPQFNPFGGDGDWFNPFVQPNPGQGTPGNGGQPADPSGTGGVTDPRRDRYNPPGGPGGGPGPWMPPGRPNMGPGNRPQTSYDRIQEWIQGGMQGPRPEPGPVFNRPNGPQPSPWGQPSIITHGGPQMGGILAPGTPRPEDRRLY